MSHATSDPALFTLTLWCQSCGNIYEFVDIDRWMRLLCPRNMCFLCDLEVACADGGPLMVVMREAWQ